MKRKSCTPAESPATLRFVSKLAAHLCDPSSVNTWTDNGAAFMVHDADALGAAVSFSHSVKFDSVKRQLNMHGFTNVTAHHSKARKLQTYDGPIYFSHVNFHRDRPEEWPLVQKQKAKLPSDCCCCCASSPSKKRAASPFEGMFPVPSSEYDDEDEFLKTDSLSPTMLEDTDGEAVVEDFLLDFKDFVTDLCDPIELECISFE